MKFHVTYMLAGMLAGALPAMAFLATFVPTASAQDVVRFGASLSLTGKTSTEGHQVKNGYDFYVENVNAMGGIEIAGKKYKVEIVYYDDQSDPQTAVQLYERLINQDGIKLLLGPYGSGVTLPASSVAEKYHLPMIEAHGASTPIFSRGYKYIFGTLNTIEQYTQNMLKMASEQTPKPTTLALINENELFSSLGMDAAAEQAGKLGLTVAYKEKYPSGTKDLSSLLAQMRDKHADVLIAGGYTADMILLVKQAKEMGVKVKEFGFLLGPSVPGFVSSLGKDAEGTLEPVQWSPTQHWKDEIFGWTPRQYADLFEKEYHYVPDYHPPQSTAALEVFHHALQKAGSLDPQKVRDAIAATDMVTAYGPIRFDSRGVNIAKSMAVIQIQNGKPVLVYPTDAAEAKFIYPLP